jgi:hypothetical protein
MLIVWESLLLPAEQSYIVQIDPRASFWPYRYFSSEYNAAVPIEWWISFSDPGAGIIWILKKPEHSRVIYTS